MSLSDQEHSVRGASLFDIISTLSKKSPKKLQEQNAPRYLLKDWVDLSEITQQSFNQAAGELREKGFGLDEISSLLEKKPCTPFQPRPALSFFMAHVNEAYFNKNPTHQFAAFKIATKEKWENLDKKKRKLFVFKAAEDLERFKTQSEELHRFEELKEVLAPLSLLFIGNKDTPDEPESLEASKRKKIYRIAKKTVDQARKLSRGTDGRKLKQKFKKWETPVPKLNQVKGAFAIFYEERWKIERSKFKAITNRSSIIGRFSKETGAIWRAMTMEQKQPYFDFSAKLKDQKRKELAEWWQANPHGPNIQEKYKAKPPRSALQFFQVDEKIKAWEVDREETHEMFKRRTVAEWNHLLPEYKKPYENKAKKDELRFEKEVFDYEQIVIQKAIMVERYSRLTGICSTAEEEKCEENMA